MTKNKHRDDALTYGDFEDFSLALKADLDRMATKDDLAKLDERMGRLDERMARVERISEATFEAVQALAEARKETADHEERIERLEDAVFKPATRR